MYVPFKRVVVSILSSVAVSFSLSSTAGAQASYSYDGPTYTIANSPFTTSMSISFDITLGSALGPNLTNYDASADIVSFTMNNGVDAVTVSGSIFEAKFTTNSSGKIVEWVVALFTGAFPNVHLTVSCYSPSSQTQGDELCNGSAPYNSEGVDHMDELFQFTLLARTTPNPNGWPVDLTGAWEFTYECGGGFNGTRFFDVTGTAPNFSVTPDTVVCGSSQRGAGGVFAVTGCSFTPDPVDVTTDGSGGYSQAQAINSVMWSPTFTHPSCGVAAIDETRLDFYVDGGVYFPATGVATSITGTVTFVGDLKYYSAGGQCGVAPLTGVVCTFDGRRNGVQAGLNQVVEPVEGVRVTFQNVLTSGKVYATILSEPTIALPGNFVFVEPALVFQITTSAAFASGAEVCLPYPDESPADGIVDGTNLTPLQLTIRKNGVSQLPLVQGPGNSVCVTVTGFSEFAVGFSATTVPALSPVGLGWLLSVVSLTGIVLLRRRSAGP